MHNLIGEDGARWPASSPKPARICTSTARATRARAARWGMSRGSVAKPSAPADPVSRRSRSFAEISSGTRPVLQHRIVERLDIEFRAQRLLRLSTQRHETVIAEQIGTRLPGVHAIAFDLARREPLAFALVDDELLDRPLAAPFEGVDAGIDDAAVGAKQPQSSDSRAAQADRRRTCRVRRRAARHRAPSPRHSRRSRRSCGSAAGRCWRARGRLRTDAPATLRDRPRVGSMKRGHSALSRRLK